MRVISPNEVYEQKIKTIWNFKTIIYRALKWSSAKMTQIESNVFQKEPELNRILNLLNHLEVSSMVTYSLELAKNDRTGALINTAKSKEPHNLPPPVLRERSYNRGAGITSKE